MEKIIIIHGTGGNPSGNWFPWLSNELRTLGYSTLVPKMPTPENQSLSSWFDAFSELGIVPDKSTIIVGHSVGAVFLLRLLERMSMPLMASVFVAGFTGVLNLPEFDTLMHLLLKINMIGTRSRRMQVKLSVSRVKMILMYRKAKVLNWPGISA